MGKSKEQIRTNVLKLIDGFLASFIDDYCNKYSERTIENCHAFVINNAKKEKQAFIELLESDYTNEEVESFRTIENYWLASIETLEDFRVFLERINKVI